MPSTKEIADFLAVPLLGENLSGLKPNSLQAAGKNSIVFLGNDRPEDIERLNKLHKIACITTTALSKHLPSCTVLIHEQPRLAFCKILERFFVPTRTPCHATTATIASSAEIGVDVAIGPGSVIENGVSIGPGTRLGNNVTLAEGTAIGQNCIIKSNTTIGEPGFGFALDEKKRPIRFPHIGNVRLGNNVEIGANCTVVRAALDTTILGDDVKTDDHVHIAHNAIIGPRTQIAAGAVLSGSVKIGADVWIGPNATLSDYISIGDGARIGIGSVVTRPVPPDTTVFGNPARRVPRKDS